MGKMKDVSLEYEQAAEYVSKSTLGAIENSLFWQKHVLANSKDQAQKRRAKAAIERLQAEIDQIKKESP